MTDATGERAPTEKVVGWRRLVSSMWGFWLLLLAVSLGAAAAIYYLWLEGRV